MSAYKCKCGSTEFRWVLASCNEDGWLCLECEAKPGEPPGFCPQLDRQDTAGKVFDILNQLHDLNFTYVSNGSMGDGMVGRVVYTCRKSGVYDQESIVVRLLRAGAGHHAAFWKKISLGVIRGQDERNRCACGKLATRSHYPGDGTTKHTCGDCGQISMFTEKATA